MGTGAERRDTMEVSGLYRHGCSSNHQLDDMTTTRTVSIAALPQPVLHWRDHRFNSIIQAPMKNGATKKDRLKAKAR